MTLDDWPGQAEVKAALEARYARWRELRRQGLSYRRIAALDGHVTHARVQQVLSKGQELITIAEAARRLGVDRRAVYIRLGSGSLKSRPVNGRQMVVWESQPEQPRLPTIEEMSGLVDDFTGGASLKDFLEEIRRG